MLQHIQPLLSDDNEQYASAEEILAQQDLPERDVKITHWHANGRPLKLKVRGLDLPTQIRIMQVSTVKNPKTQQYERDEVAFAIETLQTIRVPHIDAGTARAMVRKNPVIIRSLVDYIWALAALTDEQIEQAARALLPEYADAEAFNGDSPSADNAAVDSADR